MAFLTGYTKRWEYKVLATKVPSTQTNYPVYVDLAAMPASFWSTVANGGGDVRVTRSDGTTECAREVVSCATATDTGELHFLANSVDGTTDTVFYIYANGTSADYAVGATYGRNAVWSGYWFVYHGDDGVDSAGNAGTLTAGGNATHSTGKLGQAFDATSSGGSDFRVLSDTPYGINDMNNTDGTIEVSMWSYFYSTQAGNFSWFHSFISNSSDGGRGHTRTGKNGTVAAGSQYQSGFPPAYTEDSSFESWARFAYNYDGSTYNSYQNAVDLGTSAHTAGTTGAFEVIAILADRNGAYGMYGMLDEVRVKKDHSVHNWHITEHNNQSDHSTWATIGAEETDGGGGGFTNFIGFSRL